MQEEEDGAHWSRRTVTSKAPKRARQKSPKPTPSPPQQPAYPPAEDLADPPPRPPAQPRAEADLPHPWRTPPAEAPASPPPPASPPLRHCFQAPLPSAIGSPDNSPPPAEPASQQQHWDKAAVRLPPLALAVHRPLGPMSSPDSALDREEDLQVDTPGSPSPSSACVLRV